MNKKKIAQFLKKTLRIIIPNRVQNLFKNKSNNGDNLTIEKLNLEIKKRKDTHKNINFPKHYVFVILIFAGSLRFAYRTGYSHQGNEIQNKEIILKNLRLQIFDAQVKLEQKIYEMERLNNVKTIELKNELTTSEIEKIKAETQLKVTEDKLAKEEEKLTKIKTKYTKIITQQIQQPFNWARLGQIISIGFSLRYTLPIVWDFFTSETEDPIDLPRVVNETSKNLSNTNQFQANNFTKNDSKKSPNSKNKKSYMDEFFKNQWNQSESWFTKKDEEIENKSKVNKRKNERIYNLNSKQKRRTEYLEPQQMLPRLAIEPLKSIEPKIIITEIEPVVNNIKKTKLKPLVFQNKKDQEDIANEKVPIKYNTKKNKVEMYRRCTSSQFWNGFGPFYQKSNNSENIDVRQYFTPQEVTNMGYKINPNNDEVEKKSIFNPKPFEIVSSKQLKQAKLERKKELCIQQDLNKNINDLNLMTNLSTKMGNLVKKSKNFVQNPFNSK